MSTELEIRTAPNNPIFGEALGFDDKPVEIEGMCNADYYRKEVDQIWTQLWIYAGKEHYIPEPGDYVVKELPFAKTSVLLVRGHDGEVRAFHNVCTHRCNKLVWEERGRAKTIRCRFHGWAFNPNGDVSFIADENMFSKLDKKDLALTPIHCESWHGFIMINLAREATPPLTLREQFGAYYDGFNGYPFRQMTREYKYSIDVECNWKLLRDAFIEVYHVATLHSQTAAASFTSKEQPWVRALKIDASGFCGQYSMAANTNYVPGPTEALSYQLGANAVLNTSEDRLDSHNDQSPLVNPTRARNWAGDLNFFFPSLGIPTFPGVYVLNNFVPLGPTTSRYEVHTCYPEPTSATDRWTQEVSASIFYAGVLEDIRTLEESQQVIESGARKHFHLSDQELAVRQNHQLVQGICGPYPSR